MTQTHTDANALLMGGGTGNSAWKFDHEGVRKVATIAAAPQARQEREYDPTNPGGGAPKFFPSGDPIMGILVDVSTDERDPTSRDDDGARTFFIEGKRLKDAVRDAVRAAGASGLEVGGVLDVTLTRYDVPGDRRSGRNWSIVYTPAANAQLMGGAAPAAPAAPAAAAPQAGPVAPQPAPTPAAQPSTPPGQPTPEALAAFAQWQAQQAGQQPA